MTHMCFADVTDGHAVAGAADGRALRADGRDIQALIVSECFDGCNPLRRQAIVNRVLEPELKSGRLHSVQMRCWTPAQWAKHGRPHNLGAPCSKLPDSPHLPPEPSGHTDPAEGSFALRSCTSAPASVPFAPARVAPDSAPPPAPVACHQPSSTCPASAAASLDSVPDGAADASVSALRSHLLQLDAEHRARSARAIFFCEHASDAARRAAASVLREGSGSDKVPEVSVSFSK